MPSPSTAVSGGLPTVDLDVPILAVFVFLFLCLAVSHLAIFLRNRRRSHFFLFNAVIFGFCLSRLGACVLRMVWAFYPKNGRVSLAAQIFLNAGILIVYIVNNFLAERLLRSSHPYLGWNRFFRFFHRTLLVLVAPIIVIIIIVVTQDFYSKDAYTHRIDGDLVLFGLTYFLVIACLPLILLAISVLWPRHHPRDEFGAGNWHTKAAIAFVATCMGCIEAGFRAGTNWSPARPASDPAWYDSKASFYCFNFSVDFLVALLFLAVRIDRRFYVPNKAHGPGSYSSVVLTGKEKHLYDTDRALTGAGKLPRSPAFAALGREERLSGTTTGTTTPWNASGSTSRTLTFAAPSRDERVSGMSTPWNGSVSSRRSSAAYQFQCPDCASSLCVSSVRPESSSARSDKRTSFLARSGSKSSSRPTRKLSKKRNTQ